jgi:hypothetical protein
LPRIWVDAGYLIHEHLSVLLASQNGADGLCNVGWRENGEGDLIKERLKSVMVAAIHQGYVHGQAGKTACRVNAGKAAANDDNAGPVGDRLLKWSG